MITLPVVLKLIAAVTLLAFIWSHINEAAPIVKRISTLALLSSLTAFVSLVSGVLAGIAAASLLLASPALAGVITFAITREDGILASIKAGYQWSLSIERCHQNKCQ